MTFSKLPPKYALALPSLSLLLALLLFSQLAIPFVGIGLLLLPSCAILYYWALFRPSAVPLWVLAAISLLQDVLQAFPLGCSLGVFLAILLSCGFLRRRLMLQQFVLAWVVFAFVMLGVCVLLSLCQYWTGGQPMLRWLSAYDLPCFLTWLSYPLFHLLLNRLYYLLPKEGA